MDSWTGRKRPWEDDHPATTQTGRRDSTVLTGENPLPPHPQHAGCYATDNQGRGTRTLPPLYTSTCNASGEPLIAHAPNPSSAYSESAGVETHRPRSQTLFDVFQSKRQRLDDDKNVGHFSAIDSDRSLPSFGADAQPRRFGTGVPHREAGTAICCPPRCLGESCSSIRTLIHKLASELSTLDVKLPDVDNNSTLDSLQWAFNLVQWNNLKLRDFANSQVLHISEQQDPFLGEPSNTTRLLEAMKRGQRSLDGEEQSPSSRQLPGPNPDYQRPTQHYSTSEDSRKNLYSHDNTPMAYSPRRTASSSGSIFMPPQSPMQPSQSLRPGMLLSPSSMNFPAVPHLPPLSPPVSSMQSSAQAAHLQDLQHQVSIKTLAFQTLQKEYDSLLQKLERQRTKCATMEKKFEVSDVEINTLTDDKEKLQLMVTSLESQVEDLQESRGEARRQLVANNSQYMRIMEMASKLQAQGAEDKKRWESEKSDLGRRIRILEEAMVTGPEKTNPSTASASAQPLAQEREKNAKDPPSPVSTSASSAETISVLRAEVSRLRSRTQSLETALHTMRTESISIQSAAQQVVKSGSRIEEAIGSAVDG